MKRSELFVLDDYPVLLTYEGYQVSVIDIELDGGRDPYIYDITHGIDSSNAFVSLDGSVYEVIDEGTVLDHVNEYYVYRLSVLRSIK